MARLRSRSPSRAALLFVALAPFIVGSNNCLIAAWAGNTTMACLAPGIEAVAAPAPSCCHHASSASKPDVPFKAKSCCIGLAPPASGPTVGVERDPGMVVAVVVPHLEPADVVAIHNAERPPPERRPTGAPPPAPLSSRAPPPLQA
jgi:hypothetical protein